MGSVYASDIASEGCRLTGGFHLSEDQEAMAELNRVRAPTSPLGSLCSDGGLYKGQIFKRIFVSDPANGLPYVSAKDLVRTRVRPANFISKAHGSVLNPLILRRDMILVTRSGMNLGRAIRVREDMDGLCGTDDLIRVCGDPAKVQLGYLYAFLSTKYANTWIRKQIYGGNIKHVEPEHLERLPVPRSTGQLEKAVSELIEESSAANARANALLDDAGSEVDKRFRFPATLANGARTFSFTEVSFKQILASSRLEATFHDRTAQFADQLVRDAGASRALGELGVQALETGRMKQLYADPEYGVPFLTSSEIFFASAKVERFLRRSTLGPTEEWSAAEGDTLLARSGQLGGVVGRGVWADRRFSGICPSVHVMRIRTAKRSPLLSGYVHAFLCQTDIGYRLLVRNAFGSSVPAITPDAVEAIRIPVPSMDFQETVHELVVEAGELRAAAQEMELKAISRVEKFVREAS